MICVFGPINKGLMSIRSPSQIIHDVLDHSSLGLGFETSGIDSVNEALPKTGRREDTTTTQLKIVLEDCQGCLR